MPAYFLFLIATAALAQVTGWRLMLFPPLAVIAYEMFAHPDACPWAGRPVALIGPCTVSPAAGVLLVLPGGAGPLTAAIAILVGILILRVLALHVPPALAVGLIPFVIDRPSYGDALQVAAGTAMLTVVFAIWTRASPTR